MLYFSQIKNLSTLVIATWEFRLTYVLKQNTPRYVSTMKNIGVIGVITLGNPCTAFFLLLMMRSVMHPFEVLNIRRLVYLFTNETEADTLPLSICAVIKLN